MAAFHVVAGLWRQRVCVHCAVAHPHPPLQDRWHTVGRGHASNIFVLVRWPLTQCLPIQFATHMHGRWVQYPAHLCPSVTFHRTCLLTMP